MFKSRNRLGLWAAVAMVLPFWLHAELKDGDTVPRAPAKKEEARTWTVSGAERYYLPTLTKGDGKGYFAYYEGRLYRAGVTEDGGLEIQMLDRKGNPVSKVISVGGNISGYYGIKNAQGHGQHVPRYMVKPKEDDLKPVDQPRKKLVIEVFLEEGVEFKRTYEFERDENIVVTGLDCPNTRKTAATMGVWFPPVMTFQPSVEQPEREKALKGFEVRVRTYEGRRKKMVTFPYAKSGFYRGLTDVVEVTGPWEERTMRMKTRNNVMRPYIYTGYCPYQGYAIHITVPQGTLTSYDYKFNVEFE